MKTFVIAGAGGRARGMFAKPLVNELQKTAKLAGIFDINRHRADYMNEECGGSIPVFTDFDEMISTVKPDAVIVTTIDSLHHEYIIRALELGCNAISEKPMTTDAEKCKAILEAEKRTGKKVTVTFNCRYIPYVAKIKELLAAGTIGEVRHVNMECTLDTSHGASYFRRWHRQMEHSGGLLVHKATHQFDMVNWWLDDEPETIQAFGDLRYYGPNREKRGIRCHGCDHSQTCEFYYDITANEFSKNFYYEAEKYDGYVGDQCVFGDNIDIYDTMSVNVRYVRGAQLTFSLTAYNPLEGWKVSFVGDQGRIEAESVRVMGNQQSDSHDTIRIYNSRGELTTVQVRKGSGGHGGGDDRLRNMIFAGEYEDPLGQLSDSRAGAMSLLIGAGANESIRTGRIISVEELLR